MRAAMLHAFGDLRIEEVPDPRPGAGEVLVRITRVQPSVTEAMLINGEDITLHDVLREKLTHGPVQFAGHEFAAVIEELGTGVTGWAVGERVTGVETLDCGTCRYCREGRGVICARPEFLGFTRPGAFAELLVLPARNLVRLPDAVTTAQATAIQPLVGAIHAQDVAALRSGESVLVTGTGVMGLLAVQLARHHGAGLVVATGRSAAKRELASTLGADVVLDASGGDVADAALDLTGGIGFDVVIEAAGGAPSAGLAGADTMVTAARAARYGGRIVVVSVLVDDTPLPLSAIRAKGLTLAHPTSGRGASAPTVDAFDLALGFVERGIVDVDSLLTHELHGIEELPRAVEMTLDKKTVGAINPPQVQLIGE